MLALEFPSGVDRGGYAPHIVLLVLFDEMIQTFPVDVLTLHVRIETDGGFFQVCLSYSTDAFF